MVQLRLVYVLALGAVVLVFDAGIGPAQAQPPDPVPAAPAPDIAPTPPAVRAIKIRLDSRQEREAFLKARAAAPGRTPPTEVPPLPEQLVTPPSSVR